ncbi:hypothetical protein [Microbacterium sp.]|uniref:hypothetical protein n=1 Tax=Microbacterium sp. TaxID=51671 RepID=UPI003A91C97A
MNRFAAEGLVNEAYEAGKRVLLVVPDVRDVEPAFRILAERSPGAQLRRVHGGGRIVFPSGGRVMFVAVNSHGHRGVAADIVFVDGVADRERLATELAPCLAHNPAGELVFA